jgi:hypothetical protein
MWIDFQGLAHILERERPVCLGTENPGPSFPEFLSSARTRRAQIALKTPDRIGQDAAHQTHYRFDFSRSTPRGIKLRGHECISAKVVSGRAYRLDSCTSIVHVRDLPCKWLA